jgi:hypothetical protein
MTGAVRAGAGPRAGDGGRRQDRRQVFTRTHARTTRPATGVARAV